MKELTIEQKAKAYDEALERMKSWVKGEHPECFTEAQKAAEFIFPELKESEDERIRKDIIRVLKGEISFTSEKENEKYIAWLEKQGEKPQGKSALEAAKEEKIDNQNCVKPTDKDEPRFKVRDWVVDNCSCVWKIEGILNQFYILECPEGGESRPTTDWVDKTFHLWTIKDAKDGDVLVASDGSIFLFAGVVDCACKYYAVLTTFNEVKIKKEVYDSGYWETSRAVHPSTKEQRDLLFQKMSEAGYEWDAEKKELKKIKMADLLEDYIEQKPVKWNEEDEQHINSLLKRLDGLCRNEFERTRFAISEDRAWLKSLKERIGG